MWLLSLESRTTWTPAVCSFRSGGGREIQMRTRLGIRTPGAVFILLRGQWVAMVDLDC